MSGSEQGLRHDSRAVSHWDAGRDRALDIGVELGNRLIGSYGTIDRLARSLPRQDIAIVGVYELGSNAARSVRAVRDSRHNVTWMLGSRNASADPALVAETLEAGLDGGLFDNTNRLLAAGGWTARRPRWTVRMDSDVIVPRGWLDRFIALCEAFDLGLAGPAYTRRSTVSYALTQRSLRWLVRETEFVPAGAVTAFRCDVAQALLPFPAGISQGWGIDLHWAHRAQENGWRLGLVDLPPVRHETDVGQTYDAHLEARRGNTWLAEWPHRPIEDAAQVTAKHRRLPPADAVLRSISASGEH